MPGESWNEYCSRLKEADEVEVNDTNFWDELDEEYEHQKNL